MTKQQLFEAIDAKSRDFYDAADHIWSVPELSLKEKTAAAFYEQLLAELGFTVQHGICGIETAFSGSFGSGRPVIGILGEYDALGGLSQQAGATVPLPLHEGAPGHGCGHNLLGIGSLAAAWAVKEYLAAKGEGSGTVIFYGCPGEEGGAGKAFMAREGLFYSLDAALCWHPGDTNEVTSGKNNTSIQVEYAFSGVAAHAAADPHHGRSALDALELMNVGVQFLREHIPHTDCLHYAITDTGGVSPNVVQASARALYMVRSDTVPHTKVLLERVEDVAKGAALMTGTSLHRRFIDGTADLVPNAAIEKVLQHNLETVPLPTYTPEERTFAEALRATCTIDELPGLAVKFDEGVREFVEQATENNTRAINDFVMPYFHTELQHPGSTDVADVSWQTPTSQIYAATWPSGTPGHSWQAVSCGESGMAHKGMLYAAKVLAGSAIDLLENPDILAAAKAEHAKRTKSGYVCPIEPDAKPIPYEI